jgi:hypothetical protein
MKKTKTCGERRKEERKKQGNKEGNKQAMFNGFVWNPDTNKPKTHKTQTRKKNKQTNKQTNTWSKLLQRPSLKKWTNKTTHKIIYYDYFITNDTSLKTKMDKQTTHQVKTITTISLQMT